MKQSETPFGVSDTFSAYKEEESGLIQNTFLLSENTFVISMPGESLGSWRFLLKKRFQDRKFLK